MRYILAALLVTYGLHAGNAHGAEFDYPVGTVVTVTADGITVTVADDDSSEAEVVGAYQPPEIDNTNYCGTDDPYVECDPSKTLNSLYTQTGERPYWIPSYKVLSLPFQTNSSDVTGYFQITSYERMRDKFSEPIFRFWFSEEPNGEPLGGVKCNFYAVRPQLMHYWTQEVRYADQVCSLPKDSTLYYNAAAECSPSHYNVGACDPDDPVRAGESLNFDLSRRLVRSQ